MNLELKKIRPTFNRVIVTMNAFKNDPTGVIIDPREMKGQIMPIQRVVSVGETVKNVSEGQLVHLDLKRYAIFKHQEGSMKDGVISDNPVIDFSVPTVEVEGTTYMLIFDQDIDYVVEELNGDYIDTK